jgi:Holliday junction DNA helicase RuvB
MTPKTFSDFIGQDRAKARLELAVAGAKQRGEALGHVLLTGRPGSGKATLAGIIATTLGTGLKFTNGAEIKSVGDLTRVVSKLEKGEVLFIDEINRLPKTIEEYLSPALKNFKLYLPLDQGGFTRTFRMKLPVFTLIGSAPNPEQLSPDLLSRFSIVESMGD